MPWSGQSFKAKHNHSLSGSAAGRAAKQANAILEKTGDEGLAIAVANKNAGRSASKNARKERSDKGSLRQRHPASHEEFERLGK